MRMQVDQPTIIHFGSKHRSVSGLMPQMQVDQRTIMHFGRALLTSRMRAFCKNGASHPPHVSEDPVIPPARSKIWPIYLIALGVVTVFLFRGPFADEFRIADIADGKFGFRAEHTKDHGGA